MSIFTRILARCVPPDVAPDVGVGALLEEGGEHVHVPGGGGQHEGRGALPVPAVRVHPATVQHLE